MSGQPEREADGRRAATGEWPELPPALRARLLAYARRLAASGDEAENLVQTLYLRLPDLLERAALPGGAGREEALAGYLCRCLRNLARRAWTREDRHRSLLLKLAGTARPDSANPWPRVHAKILTDEVLALLHGRDVLTEEEVRLLRWRYLEDRSVEAIAERLGLSAGATRKRIERAVRKAQDFLL